MFARAACRSPSMRGAGSLNCLEPGAVVAVVAEAGVGVEGTAAAGAGAGVAGAGADGVCATMGAAGVLGGLLEVAAGCFGYGMVSTNGPRRQKAWRSHLLDHADNVTLQHLLDIVRLDRIVVCKDLA